MYRFLNKTAEISLKISFEAMQFFIIVISVIGLFSNGIEVRNILLASLALVLISYGTTYFFVTISSMQSNIRMMLPILGLVLSFISVMITIKWGIAFEKGLFFIYYFILWRKGMNLVIDEGDLVAYKNKFMGSLFVLITCVVFSIGFGLTDWFIDIGKFYFIPYALVAIVLMARISFTTAYNEKSKNVINKSKNIFIFNVISIIIVAMLFTIILTNFFGLGQGKPIDTLVQGIEKVLVFIVYPIFLAFERLIGMIRNILVRMNFLDQLPSAENELINNLEDAAGEYTNQNVTNLIEIGKWVILVAMVIFIFYIAYKAMKSTYLKNKRSDMLEEKEFILTKEDIKNGFKNTLKKLANIAQNVFKGSKEDYRGLPIVRRLYIDVLIKLSKEGYLFKRHFTPIEYLNEVPKERYKEAGFEKLTDYYNRVRYGKKALDENSINEANEIKKKMMMEHK